MDPFQTPDHSDLASRVRNAEARFVAEEQAAVGWLATWWKPVLAVIVAVLAAVVLWLI